MTGWDLRSGIVERSGEVVEEAGSGSECGEGWTCSIGREIVVVRRVDGLEVGSTSSSELRLVTGMGGGPIV